MIEQLLMTAALATPTAISSDDPRWMKPSRSAPSEDIRFLRCVISHESRHAGGPKAENPISTASGLFQFLDGTWQGVAKWVPGAAKYRHAASAPAAVQWEVALHVVKRGGHSMWRGTHCGHGT